MQYRTLGQTGMNISAVVYGGIVSMDAQQKDSDGYVEWALSQGINYFDVAPSYGDAQTKLGNSLVPYRDRVFLACKTEKRLAEDALKEMAESRRLLHTDYFDNYQLHAMKTQQDLDLAFGPGGILSVLPKLKEEGLIRHIGITAHSEPVAVEAMKRFPFDTVLFPFNWLIHKRFGVGTDVIKTAKERGIGILSMKSFVERCWGTKDERYTSRYPKSWCKPIDAENEAFGLAAMRYALSLGVDALVPPGNFESFKFNVDHIEQALATPLSAEENALLDEKVKEFTGWEFFTADAQSVHWKGEV